VLFFNAFELGAQSENQVFSNEALRLIVSSRAPLTTLGTLEVPEDDSTYILTGKTLPLASSGCLSSLAALLISKLRLWLLVFGTYEKHAMSHVMKM
jgi:hypothetical protein